MSLTGGSQLDVEKSVRQEEMRGALHTLPPSTREDRRALQLFPRLMRLVPWPGF